MLSAFDIEISTVNTGTYSFFVEGESLSTSKAYLEFQVEVYEILDEGFLTQINTAPFFT